MRLSLPKTYTKKLWRAIVEFDLIEPNDRIMVGFSGGKDSSFLAYALSVLKKSSPIPFEVEAVHIDLGFNPDYDFSSFHDFFTKINIPFYIDHTRIQEMVFASGKKSACARCAYFRRGAVNAYAKKKQCNKIAYAHHYDDAVETFLMSILYAGQVSTFMPKTYLSESKLTVIRPLAYLREKLIVEAKKFIGYLPIKSPCPMDGCTKRAEIKEIIHQLTMANKMVFFNVSAAMCEGSTRDFWPKRLDDQEMRAKMKQFWSAKYNNVED